MKREHKAKIGILSLGCPRNLVDSEGILGRLKAKGHPVVDMEQADVGIVNTCAFIEDAKKESIEAILDLLELKKEGGLRKVIVCGCLVQRYGKELRRQLPEVDAFVGRISLDHDTQAFPLTPRHYAYLKICESCINRCSYCVIPAIKGRFVSLGMEAALKKAGELQGRGITELNIVGQDISGYGLDLYGRARLTYLLKRILRCAPRIPWIRLLYLYPTRITDELLALVREEPRLCKYIDVPLQHVNDRVLRLMRRGITRLEILRLIGRIRKAVPGVALRTSFIVGFPSETDKEFRELVDFAAEARFERLGVFIYSREEGTAAYHFKGQVSEKVKRERLDTLMQKQQRIAQEVNRRFFGQRMQVIIDEECRDPWAEGQKLGKQYLGRSQYDAPEVDGSVYVESARPLKAGELVTATITDTLEYDLVGEVH